MKTLYYNANIYTMDENQPLVDAMLVEDNLIKAIGDKASLMGFVDDTTTLVSLDHLTVLPGFNDSHLHLYGFSEFLNHINLLDSISLEDIGKRTLEFIARNDCQEGKLILGRGWHEARLNLTRLLTKSDLDKITMDYPLVFYRVCGHVCTLNSKALLLCGITESRVSENGKIDFEQGILSEHGIDILEQYLDPIDEEHIKKTLIDGIAIANQNGITSIQTDDLHAIPHEDFHRMLHAYQALHQESRLHARIYLQSLLPNIDKLKQFIAEGYTTGVGDGMLKVGPLKILADGSLGAKTAALMEPYSDALYTNGILSYDDKTLYDMMAYAHKHAMQIAVHCIGDRAAKQVTDIYNHIQKETPRKDARHGIIHCQVMNQEILSRFKELSLMAYIQPIFLNDDIAIVESRIGKNRAKQSYIFGSMLKSGIKVTLGTDCPVASINPFENIYVAMMRKTLQDNNGYAFYPEEALSLKEAIYAYTSVSAYASFEENIKGKLLPGYYADFIVVNQDIFSIPVEKIRDTLVVMTFVDGVLRYSKNAIE